MSFAAIGLPTSIVAVPVTTMYSHNTSSLPFAPYVKLDCPDGFFLASRQMPNSYSKAVDGKVDVPYFAYDDQDSSPSGLDIQGNSIFRSQQVRANPVGAFFPSTFTENVNVNNAIFLQCVARWNVIAEILDQFIDGARFLFSDSIANLFDGLSISEDKSGGYRLHSKLAASLSGKKRVRRFDEISPNERRHHAQAMLLELAAKKQQVIAVPAGHIDQSGGAEAMDAATKKNLKLHPLTHRNGRNSKGGFVHKPNAITLAVVVATPRGFEWAWRNNMARFAETSHEYAPLWKQQLEEIEAAQI